MSHSADIDIRNQFFDRFTREYEHRFERTFGPLRGIVPKIVERFLGCGLPEGGFAGGSAGNGGAVR